MNAELTTYGLSRKKVIRILHIGSNQEERQHKPSEQEDIADIFRDQPAQPFLSDLIPNS